VDLKAGDDGDPPPIMNEDDLHVHVFIANFRLAFIHCALVCR
jgi:hypothetical protein